MSLLRSLLITVLVLGSVGCERPANTSQALNPPPQQLQQVEPGSKSRARSNGQVIYVPCYSQIRLLDGRNYNLAINLSIRNTSQTENLVIEAVDYYDTEGTLVKHHADEKLTLPPLATTEFFVSEMDPSGGSGANFLVTWTAAEPIAEPIVEAVMVGTGGSQGVSFVTSGRLLREVEPGNIPAVTPTPE